MARINHTTRLRALEEEKKECFFTSKELSVGIEPTAAALPQPFKLPIIYQLLAQRSAD
jgi:hypothetical protein